MTNAATISAPKIAAQPVTPGTPRSAATAQLRAPAVQRRRRARVVGYETAPDGRVRSYSVRCPYCRGRHQHSGRLSTDFATPWCGTRATYEIRWPETTEPAETTATTP